MSAALLPNGKQQFIDINGKPLVAGKVYMYVPNSLIFKDTWQDSGETVLNTNPIILDSRGQAVIYGAGVYRQIVNDSAGNLIWDELVSNDASQAVIDNIADLRALGIAGAVFTPIFVEGYYAVGDGGGGNFFWDASNSSADNGGTIINPTGNAGNGRWVRITTNSNIPSVIDARWFGFVGDGSTHPLSSYFGSLGAAQAIFPFVSSLSDERDGVSIQAAIFALSPYITMPSAEENKLTDYGGEVTIPVCKFLVNQTIYLNPHIKVSGSGGFQTYTGISSAASITNPGTSVGIWTGAYNSYSVMFNATGFYISSNPTFSGTLSAGSTSTIAFNASGVPSIGNNTFVGSVVTITSGSGSSNSPRLIVSGSYAAPTYTATVLDPFNNGTPDNTSVVSIPAIAQGQRYTAPEGPSGTNNFNSGGAFNLTLTPGVCIRTMTLFAGSGCAVGIRLNGCPHGQIQDVTTSGFDTGVSINASYYFEKKNVANQYKYIGTALTNDNWGIITNGDNIPLLSAGNVSRMAANNRPWYIGANASTDPNPYLNTAFYCYAAASGNYTVIGGNAEQGDRGWYTGVLNVSAHGHNIENIGLYSVISGQIGWYNNGTHVQVDSLRFGQASNRDGSGGFPYVPVFGGITPYYTLSNSIPQSGQHVKWLDTMNFTFGGLVVLTNVTPGDQDSAPAAGSAILWDSYPTLTGTVTLANSWTAVATVEVISQQGVISLRGQVTGGTLTSGTVVGTIQTEFRPAQTVYATVGSGSSFASAVTINIQTNGQIVLQSTLGSASLALDGISWPSATGY